VHPNSLQRTSILDIAPPKMPNYNPSLQDSAKVANYLKTLDTRLSQPKLTSPNRQGLINDASISSLSSQKKFLFNEAMQRNTSIAELTKISKPNHSNVAELRASVEEKGLLNSSITKTNLL
jgi:hypothetical protein